MDKKLVIIEIRRGIPDVVQAPDGVDVEIRDYDTEGYPRDELEEDEEGSKFYPRRD